MGRASAGTTGTDVTIGEADQQAPAIVVHSRHTGVSDRFRAHVAEKLRCLAKYDHKIIRLEVEVSREANPRRAHECDRVEITCLSRGPVVRAEAAAQDMYAALDLAEAKITERLRRAADRRHSRGARVARLPQPRLDELLPPGLAERPPPALDHVDGTPDEGAPADGVLSGSEDGPFVVREKVHPAAAMTLDEALANMELVGHDFYLFRDADCGTPSVVYRRRGYHYGVLRLSAESPASLPTGSASEVP